LLVSKPRDITSFGVVARLRRMTGIRRIGHAGTLDPFAEGLLVMAIGRATAVLQFMDDYDKTYDLAVEFGRTTDTLDLTGQTLSVCPLDEAERQSLLDQDYAPLRRAVADLAGERQQTPPMYSAVKIAGRPLYEYARRGETIERASRPIRIDSAEITGITMDDTLRARIRIDCSKGTYIRSLAADLGASLGYGAIAAELVRLRCGPFALAEAVRLDELQALSDGCPDQAAFVRLLADRGFLLPAQRAFTGYAAVNLPEQLAERLICGQPVELTRQELDEWGEPAQTPGGQENTAGGLATTPGGGSPVLAGRRLALHSRERLVAIGRLLTTEPEHFQLKTERVLINLADLRQA
jgi:tRNA pseudouridine55 synthase